MKLLKSSNNLLLAVLLSLPISSLAVASQAETPQQTQQTPSESAALDWFKKLNHALTSLNFDASFVLIRQSKAEPYRWRHAVIDGVELEQLSLLNGSGFESVRKNGSVSYFEPSTTPYTLKSKHIVGPVPEVFYDQVETLTNNYQLVVQGRERISGRLAQQIRVQANDKHRFSYTVSLDAETGMLLKIATIDPVKGQIEDLQVISLQITEQPDSQLINLMSAQLPEPSEVNHKVRSFNWKMGWLPEGFKLISANKHRLTLSRQLVEQQIFSDGMVSFSVYIAQQSDAQTEASGFQNGATSVVNAPFSGFEITVVGNIPLATATQIAQSILATE